MSWKRVGCELGLSWEWRGCVGSELELGGGELELSWNEGGELEAGRGRVGSELEQEAVSWERVGGGLGVSWNWGGLSWK